MHIPENQNMKSSDALMSPQEEVVITIDDTYVAAARIVPAMHQVAVMTRTIRPTAVMTALSMFVRLVNMKIIAIVDFT